MELETVRSSREFGRGVFKSFVQQWPGTTVAEKSDSKLGIEKMRKKDSH